MITNIDHLGREELLHLLPSLLTVDREGLLTLCGKTPGATDNAKRKAVRRLVRIGDVPPPRNFGGTEIWVTSEVLSWKPLVELLRSRGVLVTKKELEPLSDRQRLEARRWAEDPDAMVMPYFLPRPVKVG